MQKKNTIIWIVVGVLVLLLIGAIFIIVKDYSPSPTEETPVDDTNLKVVSQVRLKTWTTDGAIVVMDDSSSFAQLNVFVPKKYLDNQYVSGDYLSVYHNGVIKDGTVAEFEHIYKVEIYQIDSESLYNEWDVNPPVDIENPIFTDTIWPAIINNFPGAETDITAQSILAASRSYNPIYAVLCSINHGGDKNTLSIYYVQVMEGKGTVLLSESLLVGFERLTHNAENS